MNSLIYTYPLVAILALSLAVGANHVVVIRDSPISIPLVKRFNARGQGLSLLERDRARVQAVLGLPQPNVPTTNELMQYTVNVRRCVQRILFPL